MITRCLPVALLLLLFGTSHLYSAGRVELELVTEQGFAITGQQQWLRMLGELQFGGLRIRHSTGGEKVEVVRVGSDSSPVYRVTGVLTRGNQLILPGGRFSIRDKSGILDWKARLLRGGASGLAPKVRVAFGLSSDQFVALHERLADPVIISTRGKTPKEIVRSLSRSVSGGLTIDPEALPAFQDAWQTPEEMEGLSAGTVLAATIRPLGLTLVPVAKSENDVRLIITKVGKAPQSWPVGWPLEKKERDLVPKLYEFFTFEAPGNPLAEALSALQPKLDLPFLYDHNGLARQRIDPEKVIIKFPEARSYYKKILARLLFQAKMTSEVRMDEAGTPFLWLAPLKKK